MTTAEVRPVRYRLRRGSIAWAAVIGAGLVCLVVVENDFDVLVFLKASAVVMLLPVLLEVGWWRAGYAVLDETSVQIRQYPFASSPSTDLKLSVMGRLLGPRFAYPQLVIRYDGMIVARCHSSAGEVELMVNAVNSPYELKGPNALVVFRPKEPERVVEEIRRRVEATKALGD